MIGQIFSALIFIISLWLIFSEKLNRTITGLAGAALMLGLGKYWASMMKLRRSLPSISTPWACSSA